MRSHEQSITGEMSTMPQYRLLPAGDTALPLELRRPIRPRLSGQVLALARRRPPRLNIPAGSVAIADALTSIFPMETPCGWHLIGRSPVAFFEITPIPRALLAPGDTVAFNPVSLREFENLSARAAAS